MLVINNDNVLEITADYKGSGNLKRSGFERNLVLCLPLQLSYGDLKSLEQYYRSCLKELYPKEENFSFEKEMERLKKHLSNSDRIRVWSSHKNADEYLLLLYICSLFPEKNISVVFKDEYDYHDFYCRSIRGMGVDKINELVVKEHILSSLEKETYKKIFQEIVGINSELRYIKDEKLESVPIEYFDEEILSHLKKLGEVSDTQLIYYLMAYFIVDSDEYNLYSYLINRMIDENKIIVVGTNEKGKRIIKALD